MSGDPTPGLEPSRAVTVLDELPLLVAWLDAELRYRYVNQRYEEWHRRPRASFLGSSVSELLPPPVYAELQPRLEAALAGKPQAFDLSYPFADGKRRDLRVNYLPLREGERTAGLVALIQDETQVRRARRLMQQERDLLGAVLDNAGALILVLNRLGRIVRFNRTCEAISGWSEADVLGRHPWETVIVPEEAAAIRDHVLAALAGDPARRTARQCNHWQHQNGQRRLIDWRHSVLAGADGAPAHMVCIGIDITEREAADAALRQSEITRGRAEAIAHVGTWDWDVLGGGLHWTDEIYRMFGFVPQSFPATYDAFLGFVHPDDREAVLRAVDASIGPARAPYDIEHRIVLPDGAVRVVHERGEVYWEGGVAVRMIGTVLDITDAKAAEARLRDSERFLDSVIENIPDMLFMKRTSDLSFVRLNRAGEELLGMTRAELLGRTDHDFFPREQADFFVAKDREVLARGYAEIEEEPVDTRHQGRRLLRTKKIVLRDAEGRATHLLGISSDITARKRAEHELERYRNRLEELVRERTAEVERQSQRYAAVLDAAMDGFYLASPQGRLLDCNSAYCNMLGYSREELLAMSVTDLRAFDAPADVAAHLTQIMAAGSARFDTRHRRHDGSALDVEISISVTTAGGQPLLCAFVRDISVRKANEQALIEARDRAEQASRAKSEFLSRMSHELRTPLNAVLGFAQVLEGEVRDLEQQSFAAEIRRAGAHLLGLIDELLDLSRIEAGRLALVLEPVRVQAVVERVASLLQGALRERRQVLQLHCPPQCRVLADAMRLQQVLTNLVVNASKYSPPGGLIEISCQPAGPERLRLVVSDAGTGIAPEHQAAIFEPFRRLVTAADGSDGAGIGLAVVWQLVALMGGQAGVDSAPGQGSRFWVELAQLPDAAAEADPEPAQLAAEAGILAAPMPRLRLLYVEDNLANLRVVEAMLRQRMDVQLLTATHGEAGLDWAQRYQPDGILLDIHLPGLNGFEVLAALRADGRTAHIPVIALSADAMPLEIQRALDAGFDAYLCKPVDMAKLVATLDQLLVGAVRGG